MAETLTDFISNRLTELRAREKPLRQELEDIVREIEQLQRAADGAGILVDGLAPIATVPAAAHTSAFTRRSVPEKTIKEAVLAVLKESTTGLTALDILDRINAHLGVNYPRTSLSPQLSRLKADGLLRREGNIWSKANRLVDLVQHPTQSDMGEMLK